MRDSANKTTGNFQVDDVPKARCPPEKPANANTTKKNLANKTTGNFQVCSGPWACRPPENFLWFYWLNPSDLNANKGFLTLCIQTGPFPAFKPNFILKVFNLSQCLSLAIRNLTSQYKGQKVETYLEEN